MPGIPDSLPEAAPSLVPGLERFHREIVDRPDESWDRLAAGFDDACIEQNFAFAVTRWGASRVAGLLLREDGKEKPAAMALAVLATLPVIGAGIAYVKFGPLWRRAGEKADPGILAAALEALKREFAIKRGLVLRIMPPADPGYEEIWRDALASGGLSFHAGAPDRERYLVDLTLSEAEQLASLDSKWRANLTKALQVPLEIEEPGLKTGLPVFLSLYRDMLSRKKFDDRHGIEDLPKIAAAGEALGMRLFLASHQGKPVVGSIVVGRGERVFVPFSATGDAAPDLRAGYALRWAIINRLRGTKARWLDLGGAEGDSGLRHFKLGNAGKRGKVAEIPGEYDFAPSALALGAARAITFGRELVRATPLKRLI